MKCKMHKKQEMKALFTSVYCPVCTGEIKEGKSLKDYVFETDGKDLVWTTSSGTGGNVTFNTTLNDGGVTCPNCSGYGRVRTRHGTGMRSRVVVGSCSACGGLGVVRGS